MEQRNYSDHNDIRPIEDLFGRAKQPPPEPYGTRNKFYNEYPEQKPQPQKQQSPKRQPLRAESVVGNKFEAPKKREDFTLEPSIKKEPKKASGASGASHRSPALWGLLGFAIGVAFWHFVGFWSFMEDAVLRTPAVQQQSELSAEVLQRQNIAQNSRDNGISRANAMRNTIPALPAENLKACVTLVMDRTTRKTFAVHCKSGVRFFYRNRPLRTAARITN